MLVHVALLQLLVITRWRSIKLNADYISYFVEHNNLYTLKGLYEVTVERSSMKNKTKVPPKEESVKRKLILYRLGHKFIFHSCLWKRCKSFYSNLMAPVKVYGKKKQSLAVVRDSTFDKLLGLQKSNVFESSSERELSARDRYELHD